MKNNIKYVMLMLLSLVMFSCNQEGEKIEKETQISKVLPLKEYYKIINSDTKSNITIQNFSTLNSNTGSNSISYFSKSMENKVISIDGIEYSGNNLSSVSGNTSWLKNDDSLLSLFGKKVKITIKDGELKNNSNTIYDIYIPNLINLTITGLVNGKIVAGTQLNWNADANNPNGIILMAEYTPLKQESSIASTNSELIKKGSTIEDNGSYTITQSDLSSFPNNSNLSFYIGRASFLLTNNGNIDNDLLISTLTNVSQDFKISK